MTVKKWELWGILWIAPYMAGFIVFFAFPAVQALQFVFFKTAGGFSGLDNIKKLLYNKAFQIAGSNTIKFNVLAIPLLMLVSLVLAILLKRSGRNLRLTRNMLLIPLTVPTASVIAVWSMVFGEGGILDPMLEAAKLPYTNLMDSPFAFYILVLLFIWKYSGYSMIMWIVGLTGIPAEYYENASLDGAGAIRKFVSITLPLIKPTALLVFIISLVNTFKVYREAYMLAGEYPNKSIYMLQHFMNNNFRNLNYETLVMTSFLMIFAVIFIFGAGKLFFGKGEA